MSRWTRPLFQCRRVCSTRGRSPVTAARARPRRTSRARTKEPPPAQRWLSRRRHHPRTLASRASRSSPLLRMSSHPSGSSTPRTFPRPPSHPIPRPRSRATAYPRSSRDSPAASRTRRDVPCDSARLRVMPNSLGGHFGNALELDAGTNEPARKKSGNALLPLFLARGPSAPQSTPRWRRLGLCSGCPRARR
jgi:hypothetical protein